MKKLYTWREASELDIDSVHSLYRAYVNKGQVELMRSFGFGRELAGSAEGMRIRTKSGREILDFTGGVGVLNHGHNHPRILAARAEFQKRKSMEVHKNFLSPYIAALSHNIAQLLPEDLDISYFCNSGAESVEGAVKMAYKYHGGMRGHILHADISFHGKLLGSAGLTGSPELQFDFPTIPNRRSFKYGDFESLSAAVDSLREDGGSPDVYAVIIEPMNASSLRQCTTDFLSKLRKLCVEEDIVLIFDEVYTGWGKTGELFYFMRHGIVPDIVTMAKSFGGGKASIAGYTARVPVFERAYGSLGDAIMHSTTYNGFGEECATAIESVNVLMEEGLIDNARAIGGRLGPGLAALKEKHQDLIKEVRGCGALWGLLLNGEASPAIRAALKMAPGDIFRDVRFFDKLVAGSVISELYNRFGILTFYGSNREVALIVSPSLVAKPEDIDYFLNSLDRVLSEGRLALLAKFAAQRFL